MDAITELIFAIWQVITDFTGYLHKVLQGIIDAVIKLVTEFFYWVFYALVDIVLYVLGLVLNGVSYLCGVSCYASLPQLVSALVANQYFSYFWGLFHVSFGLRVVFCALMIRFALRYIPIIGK